MARQQKHRKHSRARTILRLPDLEQSRTAVLNSLAAASSQESYGHAIDEFTGWYCSEPRLAFNRTVVLRYRVFLEQKQLAPSTINVRLAAVRRLATRRRTLASSAPNSPPAFDGSRVLNALANGWGTGSPSIRLVHLFTATRGRSGFAQ